VPRISLPRLRQDLETLAGFGRRPGGGITRPAWSPAHEEARAWLLGRMKEAGLATWVDPAGNTFARLGEGAPLVLAGSHIDTVPDGGMFDGALGVLAALECLRVAREAGPRLPRPLALVAWSDEEGRYESLFGSKAFAGKLDARRIPEMRAPDGERLVEAMARAGWSALEAPRAAAERPPLEAYVELHIEQGPHLEARRVPIGIVEGIVGIRRSWVVFEGEPDHAGTTPMARRKDAFLAAAEFALRARAHVVRRGSGRSVTNFGVVEVTPGAANIVPARAALFQEMRDLDARVLARLDRECARLARSIARRRRIRARVEPVSRSEPARLDPGVQRAAEAAAAALGLRTLRLPSGAGHDAQNLARITRAGMIFIPSRGGRSHRPDESSDWRAVERGANVLLGTLLTLAGRETS
jgi:N-carbamoyl-L-amino-acid hydrolase